MPSTGDGAFFLVFVSKVLESPVFILLIYNEPVGMIQEQLQKVGEKYWLNHLYSLSPFYFVLSTHLFALSSFMLVVYAVFINVSNLLFIYRPSVNQAYVVS